MRAKQVPEETVGRLLAYLRTLWCLQDEGVGTVSSQRLAQLCHVKSSMVRKDFSYFGEFGTPGVGYSVRGMIQQLRKILKLDRGLKAALVGVGNVGRALLLYPGFREEGFQIVAAFDNDPEKVGQRVNDVVIEHLDDLQKRVREKGIRLGILATPVSEAPHVSEQMAQAGLKAILSFAPCQLNMPKGVTVHCVDLAMEMARLVYHL
ncbi:MAG: hypothetical protein AMS16_04075 [Planctomycetes bacterium DG_58]|nr:MAG: hypothetical protein AMS16_04075 [Planctomycetes bacterium DG_58]KPL03392.1 MAG: hypothetical protein AMK75_01420 [Planctomycetes bacterium SM23_65]